jgi:hypothetical protein
MTWVNLDDQMPEHPKIVALSDGAFRLHVSAISYANRYLTDGIIQAEIIPRLVPRYRHTYVDDLVRRMLWVEVMPGVYEIHDFLDWNKSRAEVEKRRAARAEGGRKGAERRWHDQ